MNTIFKILWFEDEQTWYNMEKLRVEGILNTHYACKKWEYSQLDEPRSCTPVLRNRKCLKSSLFLCVSASRPTHEKS